MENRKQRRLNGFREDLTNQDVAIVAKKNPEENRGRVHKGIQDRRSLGT